MTMQKVPLWPLVPDELKAHVVAMVIGRYFTRASLIGRMSLDAWIEIVFTTLESKTKELVLSYGEEWQEIPREPQVPIFASELISRWKSEPAIRQRFATFLDFLDAEERAIEQGMPVDSSEP